MRDHFDSQTFSAFLRTYHARHQTHCAQRVQHDFIYTAIFVTCIHNSLPWNGINITITYHILPQAPLSNILEITWVFFASSGLS